MKISEPAFVAASSCGTMSNKLEQYTSALAALFVSFIWPVSATTFARLGERRSVAAINLARAIAGVPFLILLLVTATPKNSTLWTHLLAEWSTISAVNVGWLALSALGTLAFGDMLFFVSVRKVGLSLAVAISSTYPICSALGGWLYLDQSLTLTQLIALIVTTIALIWLVLLDPTKPSTIAAPQPPNLHGKQAQILSGSILAFGAAIMWAVATFAIAKGGNGLSTATATLVRSSTSIVMCPIIGLLGGVPLARILPRGRDFWDGRYTFLIAGSLGPFAFTYCMTHGSLAVASALSSLSPLVAVLFAAAKGIERLSATRLIAVTIITAGVIALVVS